MLSTCVYCLLLVPEAEFLLQNFDYYSCNFVILLLLDVLILLQMSSSGVVIINVHVTSCQELVVTNNGTWGIFIVILSYLILIIYTRYIKIHRNKREQHQQVL